MQNKLTEFEPSGRFKEKISLKQKETEQAMLENRLKLLAKQEERMR